MNIWIKNHSSIFPLALLSICGHKPQIKRYPHHLNPSQLPCQETNVIRRFRA